MKHPLKMRKKRKTRAEKESRAMPDVQTNVKNQLNPPVKMQKGLF